MQWRRVETRRVAMRHRLASVSMRRRRSVCGFFTDGFFDSFDRLSRRRPDSIRRLRRGFPRVDLHLLSDLFAFLVECPCLACRAFDHRFNDVSAFSADCVAAFLASRACSRARSTSCGSQPVAITIPMPTTAMIPVRFVISCLLIKVCVPLLHRVRVSVLPIFKRLLWRLSGRTTQEITVGHAVAPRHSTATRVSGSSRDPDSGPASCDLPIAIRRAPLHRVMRTT